MAGQEQSQLKLSSAIELNRRYKLSLSASSSSSGPRLGRGSTAGDDGLVTLQFNFKPPVDSSRNGFVRVEKPGNKWVLDEPCGSDRGGMARFEGVGRKSRSESLLIWQGAEKGFVISKVDTSVTLTHVPGADDVRVQHPAKQTKLKTLPRKATPKSRKPAVTSVRPSRVVAPRKGRGKKKKDDEDEDEDEEDAEDEEGESDREEDVDEDVDRCAICGTHDSKDDAELLICDGKGCDRTEHTFCTYPTLDAPPEGDWFCSVCQEDLMLA